VPDTYSIALAATFCVLFDSLRHALQLRQAKLAFPVVRLLVGVFSDEQCARYGSPTRTPHLERCELVRHCRWVDEVVPDAPWKIDEAFLNAMRVEFVAIDEGVSIDPAYEKERVKGYDLVKSLRASFSIAFLFYFTRDIY
jgi:choline-phosphate cytidylyltransferase